MKRSTLATIMLLCFMVSFVFSGVNAACTAKDTTVSTYSSHVLTLYSLSSGAVMLLPLIITLAVIAFASAASKQTNACFLFSLFMTVLYIAFLVSYCSENRNNSLYMTLNEQFTELGLKVKKRDFDIVVTPTWTCFLTAALGAMATIVTLPNFKTRLTRFYLKAELEPYVFIAPQVILFITFSLVPIIYGFYAAFTKWDLYNDPIFVGLANFKTILFDSANTYYGQLRNGLWNTVKFVLYATPFCIIVPFALALATQHIATGAKVLQAIYYLPSLMSTTTVTLAWKYFFHNTFGMANNFFGSAANWFAPPYSWAMLVIVTVWWGTGGTMVIYQSALAGVSKDQYEAASIDGAGSLQKFRYITLPNMSYPLMYTLVTTVIAQFNVYGQPRLLMDYNYEGANAVLLMYIRDTAFVQGIGGIAAAMSLVLAAVIMVVSFFQIRMMRGDAKPKR